MACDLFRLEDAERLLRNKNVIIFGDSNMRAIYKDLLHLLQNGTIIPLGDLRQRCELSFLNDQLLSDNGARRLHPGRNYAEIRRYCGKNIDIEFHFMTQAFNKHFKTVLWEIEKGKRRMPDVLILNSCLWDLTRWGPNGVHDYMINVYRSMKIMKHCLSSTTKVIWTTTLPVSEKARGGFLVDKTKFMTKLLRWHIMEANTFASECAREHQFDVLDLHYYFQMQLHKRYKDGIHWNPDAVRYITNLILTHLCLSWEHKLPGNATVTKEFLKRTTGVNRSYEVELTNSMKYEFEAFKQFASFPQLLAFEDSPISCTSYDALIMKDGAPPKKREMYTQTDWKDVLRVENKEKVQRNNKHQVSKTIRKNNNVWSALRNILIDRQPRKRKIPAYETEDIPTKRSKDSYRQPFTNHNSGKSRSRSRSHRRNRK